MADSTYLRQVVEPLILRWVSRRIGVVLQPRLFPVGPRASQPTGPRKLVLIRGWYGLGVAAGQDLAVFLDWVFEEGQRIRSGSGGNGERG
jgi:hypothetical protein